MKKKYRHLLLAALAGGAMSTALVACDDAVEHDPDATTTPDVEPDGDTDGDTDGEDGTDEFPINQPGPITDARIPGLTADATVAFDDDGVPSISCDTDESCAAVLGYLHARDRFAQMDIRRRLVRGRLSEIVNAGALVVDIDADSRTLYSSRDGRPIEEVLVENASEKTMGLLEAYSTGVNAWLDDLGEGRNGASLPEEYAYNLIALNGEIADWTPADSMATVAALVESLTNDFGADADAGITYASVLGDSTLGQDVWDEYFRPWPFSDARTIDDFYDTPPILVDPPEPASATIPQTIPPSAVEQLREVSRMHDLRNDLLNRAEDRGSNNWVLAPSKTSTGGALFANDPHLTLSNPSIWYVAHMDAKTNGTGDYHAAGFTFAGLPWVIIGQNEDVAWGATNTYFDFSDAYLETLNDDGTAVMYNGEEVDLIEKEWEFPQPNGTTVTRTSYYVPHHGPVMSMDTEAGTAVTIRWTGNDMTTDVNFLTEMMRATTVQEGREAARNVTSIGQNWVMIDTSNNIGWFPYNTVPIRDGDTPGYLPRQGDGSEEWVDYWDYDDLPQAYNPANGYVATANSDMVGALADGDALNDGHPLLQTYTALGYRQERIRALLDASDDHDIDSMRDIIGDTYSLLGELVTPVLLAEVARDDLGTDAQALYDALDAWNYTCPTGLATSDPAGAASSDSDEVAESLGCAAMHRVFFDAYFGWFSDDFSDATAFPDVPTASAFLRAVTDSPDLTDPTRFWDDVTTTDATETRADIMTAAFESAATWFGTNVGADSSDWHWGRVHATVLKADLFSSLGIQDYNSGAYAKDGGAYTVNVAHPASGGANMNNSSGASMRLLCESGDQISCSIQLPGGQPHIRSANGYLGMIERWLVNTPTPLIFDDSATGTPITFAAPE